MEVDDVIKEIDWDTSNIAIPVANSENKVLEEAVATKTTERNRLQTDLSENRNKVSALKDHIKNVRDELIATQSLLNARKSELDTEKHLNMIAERESGRLKQELKRLGSEMVSLKERRNLHENEIFLANQEFDAMKSQMKWDQQALEAWLEESAQKDEDTITLQKYSKQDAGKIKELLIKIEKLEEQSHKQKKLVDEETLNTMTVQVELDKTAEDFRKAHKERQDLIKQWEQIIEQMQKRDNEIDGSAQKLMKLNIDIKNTKDELERQKKFYEDQRSMNAELERGIGLLDQAIADFNLKLNKEETNRLQFHDELGALKRTVERTSHDLEKGRSELTQIKRNINEKRRLIEDLKDSKLDLIDNLKQTGEMHLTAEENAKKMEELFAVTKLREQNLTNTMKKRSDQQFKVSQELFLLKKTEKDLEAEISGCENQIKSLENRINKLDHESLKQAEVIYTQDFNIQSLERRISRLQGEKSNDEQLVLQRKIEELKDVKEEKQGQFELLLTQFKRVEDDTRKTKREMGTLIEEKSNMGNKIAELKLHIDTAQRLLKKLIIEKEDNMVNENLMKLEIKKLKHGLDGKADEVLDLNKRRIQLEMAMKERRSEITIHQDLLKTQIRSWEEEVNTISAELQERISKIGKLKKRYDICVVSMAPPEGTPPEENSQAYYVIKAAQEKEELQREGDMLNEKIKKAEKELRALENTLKVVDSKNDTMKQSFNKVGDQSDLILQKEELEEQLRSLSDKYKQKRREMKQLQEDLRNMEEAMTSLVQDENSCEELINEKTNKIVQLDRDLKELSDKLERANKQLFTLMRELRRSRNTDDPTIEEKDFKAKDLITFNLKKSKELISISEQYPLLRQTLQVLFAQANIAMPNPSQPGSQPGSSRSSRSSSRHTSLSSASSASTFMQTPNKNIVSAVNIGFDLPSTPSNRGSGANTPKTKRST